MAIVVENVEVQQQGKTILRNASLSCQPGELLALCGPNGAGKSTLLKAISRDMPFNRGSISINHKDITALSAAEMALNRAVMPQSVSLMFPFKAWQIIEMALLFTHDQKEKDRIIASIAGLLKLDHLLERDYSTLSGGEQQRVQLARVISQLLQPCAAEQKFLLLDECTSAMDMEMMHETFYVLQQLKQQGFGIIAVVHDLNLASLYADNIVLLKEQTTVLKGSPQEVITESHIENVFSTQVAILKHPQNGKPILVHKKRLAC